MYEKSLQMDYSIFTCCKCFLGNDKLSTRSRNSKRVHLLKSIKPSSESKSSPHKNIPLTVAQHFSERRRTLSRMYKNILLTATQDFVAQYRLFCKHTTHKNTIELFSNIETCFTIFLPFVVHSLIIIFYKGLNFVYFPV